MPTELSKLRCRVENLRFYDRITESIVAQLYDTRNARFVKRVTSFIARRFSETVFDCFV